jgi:hypothetical protein
MFIPVVGREGARIAFINSRNVSSISLFKDHSGKVHWNFIMSDSTEFKSESFKGEEDAIKWLKGVLGRDYPSTPVYLPTASSE